MGQECEMEPQALSRCCPSDQIYPAKILLPSISFQQAARHSCLEPKFECHARRQVSKPRVSLFPGWAKPSRFTGHRSSKKEGHPNLDGRKQCRALLDFPAPNSKECNDGIKRSAPAPSGQVLAPF